MGKRLFSSPPVVAVGSAIAAAYIRLVYATSKVLRDPPDTDAKLFAQHPQIIAMWHGQFLMLPKIKPDRPADVAAMVARHGDAELIGAVLKRFHMRLIRGAGAGKRRRNRGGEPHLTGPSVHPVVRLTLCGTRKLALAHTPALALGRASPPSGFEARLPKEIACRRSWSLRRSRMSRPG